MSADASLLVPGAAVFGIVFSLLGLALMLAGGTDRRLRRRIDRAAGRVVAASGLGEANIRVQDGGRLAWVERIAGRWLPRREALRDRLYRTGRTIPIGGYLTACAVVGGFFGLLAAAAGFPLSVALAEAVGAGLGLPHFAVWVMAKRRSGRFVALFPDAIDLIVRGLRSGLPVSEQLGVIGAEMADPVGIEFRKIAHAVRFGQPMETALFEASRRLDIPDFKFFVVSLAVQRETGGNLAETLGNLSDLLRRRRQMRLKVRALVSEARASAMILGSLPLILIAVLVVLNPDYIAQLGTDPRGQMMAGIAFLWQLVGIGIMVKMVRFEI